MNEELKTKGAAMLENIAAMRKLREEQERSFKKLEIYALLMMQGIDPKDVRAYVYDPTKDKRYPAGANRYNVVVLRNEDSIVLNPPIPKFPED